MLPATLDDLKVLDLSQGLAGPICAKILADFGADVIKVEPPAGDAGRRIGPFAGTEPHPEKSLVFLLAYVGVKMILAHHYPIPTGVSLAIIAGILFVGVVASLMAPDRGGGAGEGM